MRHFKWQWVVKGLAFGIVMICVITFATMFLWNNLATVLFGLPAIGFFQAIGLMILGRLLTGGFRPGGWGRGPGFGRRHYMRERWKNMSEEERQQFAQRWGRHGCGPDFQEDAPETTTRENA